jgi:uncharacterized membrane protein YeiH
LNIDLQTGPPQLVLEHIGVAVAAITGVLAARGKRIDLFGVMVLALVTAFGGGTVRDVLVGDLPPAWLRTSAFLLNGTLVAVATFFVTRLRNLPRAALLVADACTLALFTMIGVRKGVTLHFSASVSVLLGVVTGVAGGILRDVLLGEIPLVFQPQIHLYATASLCGSVLYVILAIEGISPSMATVIGASLVLVMRLAAIRWKLSLPMFEESK